MKLFIRLLGGWDASLICLYEMEKGERISKEDAFKMCTIPQNLRFGQL